MGLYLAVGWGLLEFTDWATGRFDLPGTLEDGVVLTWIVLLPLVMGLAWRWGAPGTSLPSNPLAPSAPRSVAVLPFVNLSGDPEDDYQAGFLAAQSSRTWIPSGPIHASRG